MPDDLSLSSTVILHATRQRYVVSRKYGYLILYKTKRKTSKEDLEGVKKDSKMLNIKSVAEASSSAQIRANLENVV